MTENGRCINENLMKKLHPTLLATFLPPTVTVLYTAEISHDEAGRVVAEAHAHLDGRRVR